MLNAQDFIQLLHSTAWALGIVAAVLVVSVVIGAFVEIGRN